MVDLSFVKQKAEAGLYTWASTQTLLACIAKLCPYLNTSRCPSAHSDSETKSKWEALQEVDIKGKEEAPPRALCNQLEFLLNLSRVNVMRIDAAKQGQCAHRLCDH